MFLHKFSLRRNNLSQEKRAKTPTIKQLTEITTTLNPSSMLISSSNTVMDTTCITKKKF